MAFDYPEIRKCKGLFAQQNSFDVPDGALERSLNIVVNNDDIISKVRGYYQYYDPSSSILNNLFYYKSTLLAAFADKMAYFTDIGSSPNETGMATTLTGQAIAITSTRVSRSVEQNGNLYATTDNGVVKIDNYNAKVFKAGSPPALDLRGSFFAANGPISGESEVGYRVCFGRTDANDNLILGAPSDILTLTNQKIVAASWSRTSNIVTVTSVGHGLATGMSITVSDSTGAGDKVTDGSHTITVTTVDAFTLSSTASNTTGTLDYTATRESLLEFSVPREITTAADLYFFQIYRTTQTNSSTVSPTPDFRLIDQQTLTSAQITAGLVTYQDEIDDILVAFAPELYTNPNSREGELQANTRPPLCDDVALFANYVFFAKCTTRHVLDLSVVDAGSLSTGDYVELKVDATTRRYVARSGVGNKTTKSTSIANTGGKIEITSAAHGLLNGDSIYISEITGGTLTDGAYFVVNKAADTFQIALTSGGVAIAYSAVTSLYFQGVTNGTYSIFQLNNSSLSVSVQLRDTAQGLIKAVNRDASSLLYGNYASGISDTPGKIRFTAVGFTGVIYMRASSAGAGSAFAPILPATFDGTVFSKNDNQPNVVFISKVGEPEAAPLLNKLTIGSKNKNILRILPLRNSLIVLKEDGVFKVTGDSPANFTSVPLDNTVFVIAASSAALLNNQVYFLANQGVCIATDSAVNIVSRRIELLIEPIIGQSTIAANTAALGYESDRTYQVSTNTPNDTTKTITYRHNTINDTWTESDVLFNAGVVGPGNKLFLVSSGNKLLKERKYGNRLDFVGQNYSGTVVSVSSDLLGAVITVSGYAPQQGDLFLKDGVFSRIASSVLTTGSDYAIVFTKATNLIATDVEPLYERIESEIVYAPFHAGMVGRMKQFSQLQIHTRGPSVSRLTVGFTGYAFGGSEETVWNSSSVTGASGGWGNEPWGFFPWGLPDGINIINSTQPAPPIRLWVPLFQQRTTFIQTVIKHREAGESIDIQAMSWAIRAYKERVSK